MYQWIGKRAGKRLAKGIPVVQMLLAAQVALLLGRHLTKLDSGDMNRLLALVTKARGLPSRLTQKEQDELHRLVAKLEPRLFAGAAVETVSPLPLPKRFLYGNKQNPARVAAEEKKKAK